MAKQDNKTFTVAGTARNPDGTVKARFANDLVARVKILNKAGCDDINLVELPKPMTKIEALEFLQSQGSTGDASYALASRLADKTRVAKNRDIKVTLKTGGKAPTSKVTATSDKEAVSV